MKNDGGPAFPVQGMALPNDQLLWPETGMTLRDFFAAKAMAAEIAYQGLEGRDADHIAGMAYEQADAMLSAREAA